MIKSIEFENFRNLNKKYEFANSLNILIGKNSSGKSNLLDGVKLAFSFFTDDYYFIIKKSDFKDSDDNLTIKIKVELDEGVIPSLNYVDSNGKKKFGFILSINKTKNGKYKKILSYLNEVPNIDFDILDSDNNIPSIVEIPFIRNKDIFIDGLTAGMIKFIKDNKKFDEIKQLSKDAIKKEIEEKEKIFSELCEKFNQKLEIALTDAKVENEKVFIIEEGGKEHNYNIGAGYKSIANIMLNTMQNKKSIVLIDEIENHLHPSLIRTLIRELSKSKDLFVLATTHSTTVINEINIEKIIDISGKRFTDLDKTIINKLNLFLHTGRAELLLADYVILVEGYTEELLLKYYLKKYNNNWTIINVAGVMFEPYIEISHLLNKRTIVVSDNDISQSEKGEKSSRFKNLERVCSNYNIKLIEVYNTLESDLYRNGFLNDNEDFLYDRYGYMVSKKNRKTELCIKLIESDVDLKDWHVIKEITREYDSN